MRDALVVGESANDVELHAAVVVVGERLHPLHEGHEAVLVDAVHLAQAGCTATCTRRREQREVM